MAAQISSAAEAEQFVTWAKFAPRGHARRQHVGTAMPTIRIFRRPNYTVAANRDHLVAIQIETPGAAGRRRCDCGERWGRSAVCRTGRPFAVLRPVGSKGSSARVWEAYAQVAAACRKHGKHWGTVPADPAFAERCVEMGCRMLSVASDVSALWMGIAAGKTAYQSVVSSQ